MLLTRWELRYEKNQCRGKAKVPTCVMEALTGEMHAETEKWELVRKRGEQSPYLTPAKC